jgi:hypothetical protein
MLKLLDELEGKAGKGKAKSDTAAETAIPSNGEEVSDDAATCIE